MVILRILVEGEWRKVCQNLYLGVNTYPVCKLRVCENYFCPAMQRDVQFQMLAGKICLFTKGCIMIV